MIKICYINNAYYQIVHLLWDGGSDLNFLTSFLRALV